VNLVPDKKTDEKAEQLLGAGDGHPLICAACSHPITTTGARIEMLGMHVHECVNPHGHHFRIGCFAAAPGALPVSNSSAEWSWFPGYRWQVVACASCREHVGWLYTRAEDARFHGLILDALVEEVPPAPSP
jgi:hypothetical protein